MLSEVYYLVRWATPRWKRSQSDGRYLTARPNAEASGYLLLFREDYEALTYLNTHAAEVANRFAVESIAGTQVGNLVKRWGFSGVGIVNDPLLPKVEFLQHS